MEDAEIAEGPPGNVDLDGGGRLRLYGEDECVSLNSRCHAGAAEY